jgi:cellulose biosynthesis protein BcsQ
MIVTIFSADEFAKRSIIALNLAAYCALNHHKVLLLDATAPQRALGWNARSSAAGRKSKITKSTKITIRSSENLQSELENPSSYYRSRYPEIIIDADDSDVRNTDALLIATDVLVVPVHSRQNHNRQALIQRIETLRLFNPALRVLIVEIQAISAFTAAARVETNPAKSVANEILTATLADTVIQEWIDDHSTFDQGLSLFECNPRNERAITEIKKLHEEITKIRTQPLEPKANSLAILHALQRRTQEESARN